MRFICLGYFEEGQWDALSASQRETMLADYQAYDDEMWKKGHWVGTGEKLRSARTAKTLRSVGGKFAVTDGPFVETKEQLGGIAILEAEDMQQAIELMSKHPCFLVGGACEIRPVDEESNAQVEARYHQVQRESTR